MKKIEFQQECKSCEGTGLYVGLAERNGSAVVCHHCKGTGEITFKHSYNEFTGRKDSEKDIIHVVQVNPGVTIGDEGEYNLDDFGGMPYEDWKEGNPFPAGSEMRKFTCPAWWYQSADYKLKPDWKECAWGGTFPSCKHFGSKELCWARWDAENPKP